MTELAEDQAQAAVMALLAARSPDATVCPSEVARVLAGDGTSDGWRGAMPVVHAAVDRLLREGAVHLSWKGERMEARSGPYRIARAKPES